VHEYRITKYDPKNRNELGCYMVNEWTSFWDIGKSFTGEVFNYHEYINVENKYIHAIELLMKRQCLGSLRTRNLGKYGIPFDMTTTKDMIKLYNELNCDCNICIQIMPTFCRLILRDYVGAQLVSPNMFVHFGYEYYMYIGVTTGCIEELREIEASGLFVEECESPYGR